MRVTLVESPAIASMVRYARHIRRSAGCGTDFERWIPDESWHRRQMSGNPLWKIPSWIWRDMVCPAGFSPSGSLVHVVDHGWSHMVRSETRPVVVTFHDAMTLVENDGRIPGSRPPPWRIARAREVLKSLGSVDRIIVDSEASRRDLLNWSKTDEDLVHVVHPALDPVFHTRPGPAELANFRYRFGLTGEPVMLHVGSAAAYKNLPGLAEIHKRVRREAGVTLLRVGPVDPVFADLEGVVETGFLDDRDLCSAYHAADVLCLPSWHEGFGWPVVEALACGTPVVCSDRGSLPEVQPDDSMRRPPEDIEGLAAAVLGAIGRPGARPDPGRFGLDAFGCRIREVWSLALQ